MSVTQVYKKKYISKAVSRLVNELIGERLEASDKTVENFGEFIARTRRRDLVTEIAKLVDQHINLILVVDEFRKHFPDTDANGVQAGENIVAFCSFHKFLKKTPSVAVWRSLRKVQV